MRKWGGGGDSAIKGQTWDHSLISHCLAHGIQMSKQSPQGCSVIKSTATPRQEQNMEAHGLVDGPLRIQILVPRAKHWMLHSRFQPQASSSDGRDYTLAGRGEGHGFLLGPCPPCPTQELGTAGCLHSFLRVRNHPPPFF